MAARRGRPPKVKPVEAEPTPAPPKPEPTFTVEAKAVVEELAELSLLEQLCRRLGLKLSDVQEYECRGSELVVKPFRGERMTLDRSELP